MMANGRFAVHPGCSDEALEFLTCLAQRHHKGTWQGEISVGAGSNDFPDSESKLNLIAPGGDKDLLHIV